MAGQHVTGQKGKQGWNSSAARPTALSLKKGFKQKYIPSLQDYDSSRWSSIERSSPIPATDISERSNQLRTQLDPRGHLFDVLGMQAPIKRAPDPPFCCLPRTRSSLNLLFPDASARCERSPKRALGRGIHLAPLMLSSPAPRSDGGSPHSLLPSPSPHGLPPSPVVCIW
ncbi:hypothetical protein T484DRAFT_1907201 [Baffinella frigidus]|nr:hypothetical protein T484DRAFT_1907201 [Cryptophyta sp. CCMP2293]